MSLPLLISRLPAVQFTVPLERVDQVAGLAVAFEGRVQFGIKPHELGGTREFESNERDFSDLAKLTDEVLWRNRELASKL